MEAWVVERLVDGFVTGSPGFEESSGKTDQTVCHFFFNYHRNVFLVILERRNGECDLRCLVTNA